MFSQYLKLRNLENKLNQFYMYLYVEHIEFSLKMSVCIWYTSYFVEKIFLNLQMLLSFKIWK